MAVPAVQYVTTSDGVSIAYTVSGAGEPFVFLPTFLNHVQDNWRGIKSFTGVMEALAARFRLVNFDARGQGMSTRGLSEGLTLEDYLRDVDTVVERLGLNRFVLLGSCQSAFLGAHYAVRHPERVSALILVNGALSWNAWRLSSVYDDLPQQNWELFLYNLVPQDRSPEESQLSVELMKQSVTQSDYLMSARAWQCASLDEVLPGLVIPTLVLHSRDFRLRSVQAPIELAQKLPNGRLVLMDSHLLFGGPGQAIDAIEAFLCDIEADDLAVAAQNGDAPAHLTERELEVLRLVAQGQSNREIAQALVISLRTVERHITNIYAKIGARGKADATAYALRNSLILPAPRRDYVVSARDR